jgi:hypothetical protein
VATSLDALSSSHRTIVVIEKNLVKAKDVTEVLCHAIKINGRRTGIEASEVSARSFQAGGAMALLHGRVDLSNIRMMGHWHSDAMM